MNTCTLCGLRNTLFARPAPARRGAVFCGRTAPQHDVAADKRQVCASNARRLRLQRGTESNRVCIATRPMGSARPVHGLCSACARCVRGASIAWRMHGMCLQVVEQLRVRGHRETVGPAPRELTREDTAPGGRHAPSVSLTRAAALRCALCAAAVRCGCAVRASAACERCPRPSGRRGGLTHVGAACGREAAWYE